jgi:hypothetical protein
VRAQVLPRQRRVRRVDLGIGAGRRAGCRGTDPGEDLGP